MSASLFEIGRSGAAAARASIELTAQNIANANNPDYARRRLLTSELVGQSIDSDGTLNGVLIEGLRRNDTSVIQQQVRSSASQLSGTDAELAGLRDTELALEQSRLFEGLVEFEAVLTQLESNPLEPALRTNTLETARQLADTVQLTNQALGDVRGQVQRASELSAADVNSLATELARINRGIANSRDGTAGQASLFDARDATLRDLSQQIGLDANFAANGVVEVRVASAGGPGTGPLLVDTGSANTLVASFQADGTLDLSIGGTAIAPVGGALAGQSAVLDAQADYQTQLDTIASEVITRTNAAQASGADADGLGGQPMFGGTGASDMTLALTSASQIATAPAGSAAGSTNTSNLSGLIASLSADDSPAARTDTLLLGISSRISAQDITRDGLAAIAASAESRLLSEAGVDLDTEAANLVRLQQAFEANSRVIQVAADLFDTLLGLR